MFLNLFLKKASYVFAQIIAKGKEYNRGMVNKPKYYTTSEIIPQGRGISELSGSDSGLGKEKLWKTI